MPARTVDDMHELMIECATEAARVARGVPAGRLSDATPCAEFDVRALVNHWVLYTSYGLEYRARREPLPDELTGRDFAAADGWAESYADQLERAVAAWKDPAAWEGEIDLGGMAMSASDVAASILEEMAVHGWDVAVATGQEFRVSDGLGELLLGVVGGHAELYRQYDGYADPAPVPDGATAFERALALSGRDPRWTA